MRIVVGVIIVLLAHHATAEACKHKGKVLFRMEQAPLPGYDDSVPNAQFHIYATGAWGRVQEMPDGQEPSSQGGCLSKAHLKELKRALARAKFKNAAPDTCDAVAERELVYSSPKRKKKVRVTLPCGDTMDPATALFVECAEAADRKLSAKQARAICRGTK